MPSTVDSRRSPSARRWCATASAFLDIFIRDKNHDGGPRTSTTRSGWRRSAWTAERQRKHLDPHDRRGLRALRGLGDAEPRRRRRHLQGARRVRGRRSSSKTSDDRKVINVDRRPGTSRGASTTPRPPTATQVIASVLDGRAGKRPRRCSGPMPPSRSEDLLHWEYETVTLRRGAVRRLARTSSLPRDTAADAARRASRRSSGRQYPRTSSVSPSSPRTFAPVFLGPPPNCGDGVLDAADQLDLRR